MRGVEHEEMDADTRNPGALPDVAGDCMPAGWFYLCGNRNAYPLNFSLEQYLNYHIYLRIIFMV